MIATEREPLALLRDRLNATGLSAAIECLGGNVYGVVVQIEDGRELTAVDAEVTIGEPGYLAGVSGCDDEHHLATLDAAVAWFLGHTPLSPPALPTVAGSATSGEGSRILELPTRDAARPVGGHSERSGDAPAA